MQGCTPAHAAMGHCTPAPAEDDEARAGTDPHHGHGAAVAPPAPPNAGCTPAHAAMGHCTPAGEGAHARHQFASAIGRGQVQKFVEVVSQVEVQGATELPVVIELVIGATI